MGIFLAKVLLPNIFLPNNGDYRGPEDGAGMGGLAGECIQKVGKDPLVDLKTGTWRQIHEADATLSGRAGPTNLPAGFDTQARKSQFKAQAHALVLAQWSDGLHGHTLVVEVADDSAVGLVEGYVG